MPLVAPFRTSFGTETRPRRAAACGSSPPTAEGWGECVAMSDAALLLRVRRRRRRRAAPVPDARRCRPTADATPSSRRCAPVKGHRMAKAALETAVLDAELRAAGRVARPRTWAPPATGCRAGCRSASWTRIPELLDAVGGYLDEGYVRIKLKIEPGWDVEPVRAVRERFGDDVLLQVDANAAYTLGRRPPAGPARRVRPAADRAAAGRRRHRRHAELATPAAHADLPGRVDRRRPRAAADAIAAGRLLDRSTSSPAGSAATWRPAASTTCAAPTASPVWCGGMLETGIGRAANVALAALPGFTLPGDTSASGRYYATDITAPFELRRRPPHGADRPRHRRRRRSPTSSTRSPPPPSGSP